jgi:hypothetical protein
MQVLERMDILAEVQQMQTRTGAITIVDSTSKKIASMPDDFITCLYWDSGKEFEWGT